MTPKFTAETLFSGPRRSAGIPNSEGDAVLYTTQSYDFKTHRHAYSLQLLHVTTGVSVEIVKDKETSSIHWLTDDQFVFFIRGSQEKTTLCIGQFSFDDASASAQTRFYEASTIAAAASGLKVARLQSSDDQFALVFAALAAPDGSLFTSEQRAKPTRSSGRLFNSLYVRHWDRYEIKEKNALFYAKLSKSSDGKYKLGQITNALKDTGLECPIPFGGSNEFDVCSDCIIFVAKDPELNSSLNTKCNVYLLEFHDWSGAPVLRRIVIPDVEGSKTCPVISPDGSIAAFLAMSKNGIEAGQNSTFLVSLREESRPAKRIVTTWDRNPSSIRFTNDGKSLIVVAEETGKTKLFLLDCDLIANSPREVRTLTTHGSITDAGLLADGSIFVSGTSMVDDSFFSILDPSSPDSPIWSNSHSLDGSNFGLNPSQVSSIWIPASNPNINAKIHCVVVKPSTFDPSSSERYPVAYIIHGGPQSSWKDNWNVRWNLAVIAEQGYIVVGPNITGSTGYGQAFTDSINADYGGGPYQDIVNCYEWVGEHMLEADNDRAVALGHSFGGYMMNWIQGHELGRKFKALVCHNGIATVPGLLATDELYNQFHEHGGTPWHHLPDDPNVGHFVSSSISGWRPWDPSDHFSHWATPQLVIHNSRDYRVPVAQGLTAFNVLQARGIESQFLNFPDENHWVSKPENALVWYKVVLNWINKYVGLPTYAAGDPESEAFWGGAKIECGTHDAPQ